MDRMDFVSAYPPELVLKFYRNSQYGKATMGKYIIKKWFNNQWMIVAPGGLARALCISFDTAVSAMDTHAISGRFIDETDPDKFMHKYNEAES